MLQVTYRGIWISHCPQLNWPYDLRVSFMIWARHLAAIAAWVGPITLAIVHLVLVVGVLAGNAVAVSTADYLLYWPLAEFVSLIVTPYFMDIAARDHHIPRWLRVIWLPLLLLAAAGIGGAIRFLEATWVYILARVPTLWAERYTRLDASAGCFRAFVSGLALALLGTVFLDRPLQGPIGGSLMPAHRELANVMALGAVYFVVVAVIDYFVQRELVRQKDGAGLL